MPAGRPLRFETVEQLKKELDSYFKKTPKEEWTMTGLCLVLEIDYQTLINYSRKEEYFEPIKIAKLKVHNEYEKSLRKNGRTGDIFALKNFGWKDRQEINNNVTGVSVNIIDDLDGD